MNIKSIDNSKITNGIWNIEATSFYLPNGKMPDMKEYVVQKGEAMRLDLIIQSIYEDANYFEDSDVLLYLNNIDNPLNIREGMTIYYPESPDDFDAYRYTEQPFDKTAKSVKEALSVPNKTTRKDENRKKFLESDYSLPPTVLRESRPPVIITNNTIEIGGLK